MFQNAKCAQSVSLLQNSECSKTRHAPKVCICNSEMFENTSCTQSVYLLRNREMFENEIKNRQSLSINEGLIFNLSVLNCMRSGVRATSFSCPSHILHNF